MVVVRGKTVVRAEVLKVMTLDYTFERRIELQRVEAREEGRMEGRAEEKANSVIELLGEIAPVPDDLKGRILAVTDLEVLGRLLKKAAKAQSIEEFEGFLAEEIPREGDETAG